MMVRLLAHVGGFYGALSIRRAMRRQHKVPVLSEAGLLMKNAREHLRAGFLFLRGVWLVIRRQALLSSSTSDQLVLLTMARTRACFRGSKRYVFGAHRVTAEIGCLPT
jgi:hypothetical protein